MGSDAFFQNAPAAVITGKQAMSTAQEVQEEARAVEQLVTEHGLSQRHAYKLVGIQRSSALWF